MSALRLQPSRPHPPRCPECGLAFDWNKVIDVPDTPKNRRWMKAFKQRWKSKLEQLELWMVSYLVTIE